MIIPAKNLTFSLDTLMGVDTFALISVTPKYDYVNKQRTDTISAICYRVANPETFENFEVKVSSTKAIVSQERIDNVDERLWVTFENAVVKPYKIEFGKAICTVPADSVKLVSAK